MGSTKSGKRKLPQAAPKQLPAEGAANKRTPQSTFDAAAGKDTYEPERVVAERLAKGVTLPDADAVPGQVGRLRREAQYVGAARASRGLRGPDRGYEGAQKAEGRRT